MFTNHPEVEQLGRLAYPDYTGRKFQVHPCETVNVSSYWEGGTRSFFKFVRLHDMFVSTEIPAQSAFDQKIKGATSVKLIPGLVCVEHTIFCGKDMGICIHVHPENAPRYLHKPVDLTDDEKIVLKFTVGLKSSYAGIKNYQYYEANRKTGITWERWNDAKKQLISKKLLNAAGAVTNEGRNVMSTLCPI